MNDSARKLWQRERDPVLVFPLPGVVFFPGTTKPLNIFEPRYIQMIDHALETETPVALVSAEPAGTSAQHEGVLAHLRAVAGCGQVRLLERRPDGGMLIALEGIGKIRLQERISSDEPFIRARVDWINESTRVSQSNLLLLHRLDIELKRWLEDHVQDPVTRAQFATELESAQERVNYYCSLAVADPEVQQQLLEMDSLDERLEHLALDFNVTDEALH